MKRWVPWLAGFAIGVLLCTNTGQGRDASLRARIPFDFRAADREFRAGVYELACATESAIILKRLGDDRGITIRTMKAERTSGAQPELAFRKYNDEYFLHHVVDGLDGHGHSFFASPVERTLARQSRRSSEVTISF